MNDQRIIKILALLQGENVEVIKNGIPIGIGELMTLQNITNNYEFQIRQSADFGNRYYQSIFSVASIQNILIPNTGGITAITLYPSM